MKKHIKYLKHFVIVRIWLKKDEEVQEKRKEKTSNQI